MQPHLCGRGSRRWSAIARARRQVEMYTHPFSLSSAHFRARILVRTVQAETNNIGAKVTLNFFLHQLSWYEDELEYEYEEDAAAEKWDPDSVMKQFADPLGGIFSCLQCDSELSSRHSGRKRCCEGRGETGMRSNTKLSSCSPQGWIQSPWADEGGAYPGASSGTVTSVSSLLLTR